MKLEKGSSKELPFSVNLIYYHNPHTPDNFFKQSDDLSLDIPQFLNKAIYTSMGENFNVLRDWVSCC
jgi:hypothetical protein